MAFQASKRIPNAGDAMVLNVILRLCGDGRVCVAVVMVAWALAGPVSAAKPTGGVASAEQLLASTDASTVKPGPPPAPNCYAPVLRRIDRLRA